MPYLGLGDGDEVRFGKVRIVSVAALLPRIGDLALRKRVSDILRMYRDAPRQAGRGRPLRGIGVFDTGALDFHPLTPQEHKQIAELRTVMFLGGLSVTNRLLGPNAGHSSYTSENFDVVSQRFSPDNEWIAEMSGLLIRITNMGFKIGETQFQRPSYVNLPLSFRTDVKLLSALLWLRRNVRSLYTRIIRAAAVFLESHYNAPNVDIRARVLLQASAFEILLDLPEQGQRLAFKDAIERLLNERQERRFRISYEKPGGRSGSETRSVKGLWADRFYTLRNHIIHGETVSHSEYVFRRHQHHLICSPLFFVMTVQRLIDEARLARGLEGTCSDRLRWAVISKGDEYERRMVGFRVETDFYALFEQDAARKKRRARTRRAV